MFVAQAASTRTIYVVSSWAGVFSFPKQGEKSDFRNPPKKPRPESIAERPQSQRTADDKNPHITTSSLSGPFHKNFSAVIGPNGSGKSNTIDALQWVFGHNAKKIRLKKSSDLIHNSTALPDCKTATVTVEFHDIIEVPDAEIDPVHAPKGYQVVADSKFSITRKAYKSNATE